MNESTKRENKNQVSAQRFARGIGDRKVCGELLRELLGREVGELELRGLYGRYSGLPDGAVWLQTRPENDEPFKAVIQLADDPAATAKLARALLCVLDDPHLFDEDIEDRVVVIVSMTDPVGKGLALYQVSWSMADCPYDDGSDIHILNASYGVRNTSQNMLGLLDFLRTGENPSTALAKAFAEAAGKEDA